MPIAAPATCAQLAAEVDDVVCAATPDPFYAVGDWYADFSQVGDAEVRALLDAARRGQAGDGAACPARVPEPPGRPVQEPTQD